LGQTVTRSSHWHCSEFTYGWRLLFVRCGLRGNGDFARRVRQEQIAIRKARSLAWNTRVMAKGLSGTATAGRGAADCFALPPAGSRAGQ